MIKSQLNFHIEKANGEMTDMYDIGLWVNSFHISSPDAENNLLEVPGMNGARHTSTKMKVRKVEIVFQVETDSLSDMDDLKHLVYATFYDTVPYKIVRGFKTEKMLYALQDGAYDIDNITPEDGEFTLTLVMVDPVLFGLSITQTLIDPNNANANLIIQYSGTAEGFPIFTVTFTAAASDFKLMSPSGEYVRVIWGFVAGDVLIIDHEKEKITINDNVIMTALDWANSDFFVLEKETAITVEPSDTAVVKINYTTRWL